MVKYLNPSDVKVSDAVTVVDIREQVELQRTGIVDGAVHIPLGRLPQRMNEISKEKPVYLYCAAGGRASQACEFLTAQGYDAYNTGGITDWFHAGHNIIDI
jgi:rhodanese-related sulfurtransferase